MHGNLTITSGILFDFRYLDFCKKKLKNEFLEPSTRKKFWNE